MATLQGVHVTPATDPLIKRDDRSGRCPDAMAG
jgi:hypothetical protein